MSDQPHGRGMPVWVYAIMFLGVALVVGVIAVVAGTAFFLLPVTRSVSSAPTSTVSVMTVPTATVEPTAAPIVTTSTVAPTSTPKTVREPALVTKVTGSSSKGYRITVDYIQILTGKAAADAATAAGEESPPPNDYFILNASTKLRTFALPKTASITVLGWAGVDATAKKKLSVGQFMDIMPGGTNPQQDWVSGRYYVTVKNGTTVTKIEQIFFP
jgi:hypothetical protein